MLSHEAVDGGLEVNDGMKDAVLETPTCQFGEETFDGVQP